SRYSLATHNTTRPALSFARSSMRGARRARLRFSMPFEWLRGLWPRFHCGRRFHCCFMPVSSGWKGRHREPANGRASLGAGDPGVVFGPASRGRGVGRRARMSLRIRNIALALLLMLLAAGAYKGFRYPGLTRALRAQFRYGTWAENRNMYLLSKYWFYYLSQLTPDPDGFYNFNAVREDSLNDLEKGKLAYHRGRFSQAIAHIERHLALHRETEEALFWLAVCYMRQAEAENCLSPLLNGNHSHASFCSLPLARFHDRPALARKAAKLFEELLERCDGSNRLYR